MGQGPGLRSTNVLTNRGGQLVQHYEYSAFGKEVYAEDIDQIVFESRARHSPLTQTVTHSPCANPKFAILFKTRHLHCTSVA